MKLKLTIEYDGSSFSGWQWQDGLKTVQEDLERSFNVLVHSEAKKREIELDFSAKLITSGRTDAGVHARGQVVSLAVPDNLELDPYRVKGAINGICDPAINILKVETAADNFDARFSPHVKQYSYYILLRYGNLALYQNKAWRVADRLDIKAMAKAARMFVGQYDFTSFAAGDCESKTKVRTIYLSELSRLDNTSLVYTVQGPGFLKQMVRIMVGTLVEVGKGKFSAEDIPKIIAAKERRLAGETAPAQGLYLEWVRYNAKN